MPKIKVISSLETSEKVVKSLLCLDKPVIGVNCKGADLGPQGRITQVTISTCYDDVYIFDVRRQPNIILDGAIIRLFQSRELVKVFYDCKADSSALKKIYGVDINNYFDIQLAFSTILEQHGFPPRKVSLSYLCDRFEIDRFTADRAQQMKMTDINYWALRPLTSEMIDVSAADVLPLIPVYHCLTEDLSPDMFSWFECQSIDSKFYNPNNVKRSVPVCKRMKKIKHP